MNHSRDELISQADTVSVDGWDFSWLDGRATEERPGWGYQRLQSRRPATATAALDIQTGGGEVSAEATKVPPVMVATESWPPNIKRATELLHPRGVVVVADRDEPPLPFAAAAFDLVTSRHPATVRWPKIARVLRSGGCYFAQDVGPATVCELTEYFLGPQPHDGARYRDPDSEAAEATENGLRVVDLRAQRLKVEFFDIGAVVYFLRKVIWTVPDFSVARYRERLADLHEHIQRRGSFLAHSTRHPIEARKP